MKGLFSRSEWLVLGLALALRVVVGLLTTGEPGGDAREYLQLGENLAEGNGFSLSETAPYAPTDWRMPAYPGLIAGVETSGLGMDGLVVANSLLGTLAVAAILLMSKQAFGDRARVRTSVGLAAALYPSLVTYTALGYAENLSVAALAWLVYIAYFAPLDGGRWGWWLAGWFVFTAAISMGRAEGIFLVAAVLATTVAVRRLRWSIALGMALLAVVAPVAWAVRNEHATGRFELVDPINRDATLVLSVNDGDFTSPLYARGAKLATEGLASAEERAAYHDAVMSHLRAQLRDETGSVLAYKAKSLLNFPFIPVVWAWSAESDYSLSEAASNLDGRNLLRVAWAGVLLIQYALALIGLVAWWRQGRRAFVVGVSLYPLLAVLLAIPFHSELRLWFAAAFLLILPAGEGASRVLKAWRTRIPETAAEPG